MRHALVWALWFGALFFLWVAYVGEWNDYELVAAACTASVSAGALAFLHAKRLLRSSFPLAVLRRSASVLPMILVDFGIITFALFRSLVARRRVHGTYLARPRPPGTDPAWAAWLATFSPNALVVDVDPDEKTVLLHDIVPNRSSESPVA